MIKMNEQSKTKINFLRGSILTRMANEVNKMNEYGYIYSLKNDTMTTLARFEGCELFLKSILSYCDEPGITISCLNEIKEDCTRQILGSNVCSDLDVSTGPWTPNCTGEGVNIYNRVEADITRFKIRVLNYIIKNSTDA